MKHQGEGAPGSGKVSCAAGTEHPDVEYQDGEAPGMQKMWMGEDKTGKAPGTSPLAAHL